MVGLYFEMTLIMNRKYVAEESVHLSLPAKDSDKLRTYLIAL